MILRILRILNDFHSEKESMQKIQLGDSQIQCDSQGSHDLKNRCRFANRGELLYHPIPERGQTSWQASPTNGPADRDKKVLPAIMPNSAKALAFSFSRLRT